jgi:hypothetical protein
VKGSAQRPGVLPGFSEIAGSARFLHKHPNTQRGRRATARERNEGEQVMQRTRHTAHALLGLGVLAAVLAAGCPASQNPTARTGSSMSLLFTSGSSAQSGALPSGAKAAVVPIEEILSLKITIQSIGLIGEMYDTDGPVVIVDQPFDVDLVSLLDINELIESAEIPPGNYSGALIQFSDPMLELAGDPGNIILDIMLPDNGFFLIPAAFTAVENEAGLLVFDLGGITLIELDGGGYQLVPDLSVDLFDTSLIGQAVGEIDEIDRDQQLLVLEKHDMRLTVDYAGAVIFLPDDFTTPTGTPDDLNVGQEVFVFGSINFDGSIAAATIVILDDDDDDHNGFERCIRFDLEHAEEDPDARGRLKYKEGPNRRRLEIRVKDVDPVQAVLVYVDGVLVADLLVEEDQACAKLDTKDGAEVPEMTMESIIEVYDADSEALLLFAEGGRICDDDDDHEHDDHDDDHDDDEDDDHDEEDED